jgi:hypothetical protein
MFTKFRDFLWPVGATVLALLVAPTAIEQYPKIFKEAPWILPLGIVVVCTCWIVPLLVHDRVRRIHGWIIERCGARLGWIVLLFAITVALGLIVTGGYNLYNRHKRHLEARLQVLIPAPEQSVGEAVVPPTKFTVSPPETMPPKSTRNTSPAGAKVQPKPPNQPSEGPILISATFFDPQSPVIVVSNPSDMVAEGVAWAMVAIRTSDLSYCGFVTQSIGYIKSRSASAPYLLDVPRIPKGCDGDGQLKDGDELTGSISVDCPQCEIKTYIIHFVWGKSGWFFEWNDRSGYVVPKDMSKAGRAKYIQQLTGDEFAKDRIEIVPRSQ